MADCLVSAALLVALMAFQEPSISHRSKSLFLPSAFGDPNLQLAADEDDAIPPQPPADETSVISTAEE
jgi:hypothetical protein